MKFFPVLDVKLLHSYYTDGRCPDFVIEPTVETQRLLANCRCVTKTFSNGIRILGAGTDGREPLIPVPRGAFFIFDLRLQNSDFALFTDLSPFVGKAPVFTNAGLGAGATGLMQSFRQAWKTESFAVQRPARTDRFVLAGQPLEGLQPTDFEIEGLGSTARAASYDGPSKTITVDSTAAEEGDVFTVQYPTKAMLGKGVFAEIEISANESLPNTTTGPGEFVINFAAKQARWKYYCVTDLEAADGGLRIVDAGASPVVFSDSNRTYLNQHPDPTDEIASALEKQYPDKQRFRFVSDSVIRTQQAARKQFQLRLGDNRLADALPNPSLSNYSTMEVDVGGTVQKQDVLFHIIKHFQPRNSNN